MNEPVLPPSNVLDIALSLGKIGWHVLPVTIERFTTPDGHEKRKKTPSVSSFSEASTDPHAIREMWLRNPDAWPGVVCGPSNLIALDLDHHEAPEFDGKANLKAHGLKPPKTLTYRTLGGGKHFIYQAPRGVELTIAQGLMHDGERMIGVDVRGGSGYFVYYGEELDKADRKTLADAPEWTVLERKYAPRNNLDLSKWLDALAPGPMSPKVEALLARVSDKGMGHQALLDVTSKLAEYGSLGVAGVGEAVIEARKRYSKGWPADYARAFDGALLGSANHFGAPVDVLDVDLPEKGGKKGKKGKKKDSSKKKPKGKRALVAERPDYLPNVVIREARPTRWDDFFDKSNLLAAVFATEVQRGDIARGPDGQAWTYADGVWSLDSEVFVRRAYELLGDRFRPLHASIAQAAILTNPRTAVLSNDPQMEYMNLRNGMYRWETGELLPHDPGYLSIVQLPVSLDLDAECPAFDAWLDEVVSPDVATVVWEVIAYTLMSGNPLQMATMLVGPGGTGKGTLGRVLKHLVGEANTAALSPGDMNEKFRLPDLLGKLLNIDMDLPTNYLPDSAMFKKVTGGDLITAERKNQDPFRFTPWAFPVYGANDIARSGDVTSGYFRRWLVLPFEHFVDRTKAFDEGALYAEADGIFRKAMRFLPGLMARRRFTETIATMNSKADFEKGSDMIRTWLSDDEHIVGTPDPASPGRTMRPHLYDRYKAWSLDTGHGKPVARDRFVTRLRDLGFEMPKVKGSFFVRGIVVDSSPLGVDLIERFTAEDDLSPDL